MTITQQFAGFLSATHHVEGAPAAKARAAIFDLVTAAIGGFPAPGAMAAREAAKTIWGGSAAPVWLTGERLSTPGAAFANSAAASVLDLDDGHRAAAGHPGASIIPAVFATAAITGDSLDQRIITAITLGYEVAVRIAASRDFAALTTMVSGPWVGQGAAAAAAWLRRLSPEQTTEAIAIAGASAPNLAAVAYSRVMGNHLKEGIPWRRAPASPPSTSPGGFTGPTDLLDNDELFAPDKLLAGLGSRWAIEGVYFKPYSCCRWAHAAIDAVLDLKNQHSIAAGDITGIEVETFGWALRLNNEVAPRTLESAQYSVPFCVALAATAGGDALVRLSDEWLAESGDDRARAAGFSQRRPTVRIAIPIGCPRKSEAHDGCRRI